MANGSTHTECAHVVLRLGPVLQRISSHEFYEICQLNRDLRIERTSEGELIIMPPTGGETGGRGFRLTGVFSAWVEKDGRGVGFDSSTGFALPNGATRSPDLAWVTQARWDALTPEERQKFPPLCPDFVLELRSPSDSLEALQAKMEEYQANGARLGWLIDPVQKRVYVYAPGAEVRCLERPPTIAGDPVLPGFVLKLDEIWA